MLAKILLESVECCLSPEKLSALLALCIFTNMKEGPVPKPLYE